MKTAVVTIRKEPHYRRDAIERGLKHLGYAVTSSAATARPGGPESLLLLWNKKKGSEEQMADRWEAQGGTVIVMENGYLQKADKSMYALSVHGHNGSGWFPIGNEDRFSSLGFDIKGPQRNPGGHVLVCGQRGIGSAMMASPPQWAEKLVAKLKARYAACKLRSHPGNHKARTSLLVDLVGASTCHIWSSGAGVRGLVEGVPTEHHAPYWICSGDDRKAALHRMSHGQWAVAEIAAGEPFARMLDQLKDAKWG